MPVGQVLLDVQSLLAGALDAYVQRQVLLLACLVDERFGIVLFLGCGLVFPRLFEP